MTMSYFNHIISLYRDDNKNYDFCIETFTSEERIYLTVRNELGDDLVKLNFDYFPEVQYDMLEFNLEYLDCEKYSMNDDEEKYIKHFLKNFEMDQA